MSKVRLEFQRFLVLSNFNFKLRKRKTRILKHFYVLKCENMPANLFPNSESHGTIVNRYLKICLFEPEKRKVLSNIHTLWAQNGPKNKPNMWTFNGKVCCLTICHFNCVFLHITEIWQFFSIRFKIQVLNSTVLLSGQIFLVWTWNYWLKQDLGSFIQLNTCWIFIRHFNIMRDFRIPIDILNSVWDFLLWIWWTIQIQFWRLITSWLFKFMLLIRILNLILVQDLYFELKNWVSFRDWQKSRNGVKNLSSN